MNTEMNETFKSIRIGTVDFFGILIPGLLTTVTFAVGFFVPIIMFILYIAPTNILEMIQDPKYIAFILVMLVIFSYVLGYILRLSSPDELDKISARNVILKELDRMSEQEEKEQEETGKKNERKYKVGSIYRRFA
jgi:uncharacterized protein YacL